MDFEQNKKYRICIDNNGKNFFYSGYFISQSDDGFINFQDIKIGKLILNKKLIIKVEEQE